jgi:tRNA-modifying protein YgfZ
MPDRERHMSAPGRYEILPEFSLLSYEDRATRNAMPEESKAVELSDLGVLSVHGADAVRFLQGQLSSDVTELAAEGSQLAGYHNPQGRVIAVLRLVHADGHVVAVMPRELIAPVSARLTRFVLRAKVQLTNDSAKWRVRGLVQPTAAGDISVKVGDSPARWLTLVPRVEAEPLPVSPPELQRAWRLHDIARGLPQVYARTSEAFVAQMLNLDLLDAVAFSKGCYTGQEVIARAHYRGRVKRRMQRWRTLERAELAPGDTGRLADGRVFRVAEAAQLPDGRCEFLAVAPLDARADPGGEAEDSAHPPLAVESLPLPYELPR